VSGYHRQRDRWRTRAAERVLFALARGFRWLTWPVPDWRLTGLCAPIGGALAVAVPSFRRRAEDNLALVRPELSARERHRLVRAAGAEFTRLMVEYARLDRFLRDLSVETIGAGHLLAAREAGRGAVLVSAHYGNWEAARIAALRLGCETGIIYRAFNNRYLDRFTLDLIPVAGRPVLQKGRQGMRQLVRHVGRGGFVMVLVDQRTTGAPLIDFLGRPAETATAPAELALKTGAALIPVRATRNAAARRFDVSFEPPVTGSDARAMMAEVNRRIGAWVEERPEQWFWFHRRWRRARPGDAREG
jgi:KDO2-lipid IV(A) lauroyltransferase